MAVHNLQEFVDFVYSEEFECIESFDLSGWPRLDVKIYGGRYNGTITPDLAKSLYDFYMDLQRAYAYIKYGTPNLQKLTLEDKRLFSSIEYRIEEGSLKIFGDLSEQVTAMCDSLKGVMEGMESKHKTAVFITLVLAVLGGYSVSHYFDYQTQVAKAEQQRQQQKILIDGQEHTVDAMLEQSKQFIQALSDQAQHRVYGAIDKLDEGYAGIIRSVPDAEMVDISGAAMSHDDIEDYIQNPQPNSQAHIVEEELSVVQVSKRRFPRISVRFSNADEEEFTLGFVHGEIPPDSYERIFESIKNGTTVLVQYNALIKEDGVLHKGTVLSVSEGHHQNLAGQSEDEDDEDEEA